MTGFFCVDRNEIFSSASSFLGQEPNHQALKTTGEQQECLALAILPDSQVCMHDWFCSWESYALCEIRMHYADTSWSVLCLFEIHHHPSISALIQVRLI